MKTLSTIASAVVLLMAAFVVTRSTESGEPTAPTAPAAPASPAAARPQVTNSIGMKLVRIPAGAFKMGSPRDEAEREAEEVLHAVTITKSFYMGVYEVTQAEFREVMGAGERDLKPFFDSRRGGGPDHPMEVMLWKGAEAFCKKLSARPEEVAAGRKYRLPTEAEWEYACRAGTKTAFHFGDTLSSREANFNGNYPYGGAEKGKYLRVTAKVGSYEPNAFGLHDMHGNVAEWCADWYDPKGYANAEDEDPLGPPFGAHSDDYGNFYLVVRGGSWLDDARACRSAYREKAMHRNTYKLIGFRVVCEVESEK